MVTRVTAEHLEKGNIVTVANTRAQVPTETGCHTLFVEDDGKVGRVWLQSSFFKGRLVLPLPLFARRNAVEVNRNGGERRIWTGGGYRRVTFTEEEN